MSNYYRNASTTVKSKIIGSIFPEKLIYSEKQYRTTKVNEVLALILNTSEAFKTKQPNNKVRLSSVAPESGLEPETL